MNSVIARKNRAALGGYIYASGGVDEHGERVTLCPTTRRRFVARISVITTGFVVERPGGGAIEQLDWPPRGGRAALLEAARNVAKRTLEHSFASAYGLAGFVWVDTTTKLPSETWAAWGYTRDNAASGQASICVPYFDVLVPT